MDRADQNLFKIFLAFVGIFVFEPAEIILTFFSLPYKTDFLYWSIVLVTGVFYYFVLTFIGVILRWVDRHIRLAIQGGFRPILFPSASGFWTTWTVAVAYIPLFWAVMFGVFFAYNGGDRVIDAITTPPLFVVLWFLPPAAVLFLTLINLPLYLQHLLTHKPKKH